MRVSKKAGKTIVKASRGIRSFKKKQSSLHKRAQAEFDLAKQLLVGFKHSTRVMTAKYEKALKKAWELVSEYEKTHPNDSPAETGADSDLLRDSLLSSLDEQIDTFSSISFEDSYK